MTDEQVPVKHFEAIVHEPSKYDQQISELQEALTQERDGRREDRFVFIAVIVLLLDVVFFSVMPSFGGPVALLIFELVILIPLAKRMGMEEFARILNNVLDRAIGKANNKE
jgi:hypothetical protein